MGKVLVAERQRQEGMGLQGWPLWEEVSVWPVPNTASSISLPPQETHGAISGETSFRKERGGGYKEYDKQYGKYRGQGRRMKKLHSGVGIYCSLEDSCWSSWVFMKEQYLMERQCKSTGTGYEEREAERNCCVQTVTHAPNAEPHCAAQGGEVSAKKRT